MKTLKYSFGLLLSLIAMISISSCEEFATVSPDIFNEDGNETVNQVYFAKELAQQIDIAPDTKSFDIPVKRSFADAAVSVPVTVTADSLAHTIFEFPATIEFADSTTAATYTIAVKEGAVIEYAVYHNITIEIEKTMTTPYVLGSYSFAVGAPEPWSEWKQVGTGTFTLAGYWSGTHSELPIYYREYMLNDVDAEFYIPGVANAMDLTIKYNRQSGDCQVDVQFVLNNDKYGPVYVCDYPHYPLQPGLTYEDYPCHYNAETGLFTLNLIYFVSTELGSAANGYFGMGEETFQLDGFEVPVAPDYSFSMEFRGHYIDNAGSDNAVIATTKGADVAKYLMTVIGAKDDAQATITGMLNGTVACDTLTESGFYAYPMTESGKYMALAITFDAEDNALEAHSAEFEFYMAGQENPWQSLGYAVYTDDIILPAFGNDPMSYYVEVLENKDQPGLFRMVDPYGPEFPLYPYASSYADGTYIEIDATDPEGVWIEGWQSAGIDVAENGLMSVTSMAWYQANAQGATKEDAKDAGLCGIYADGVITFPVDGLLFGLGGKAYYANRNGAFALDMTNMIEALPEGAAAARSAAARVNLELNIKPMGKVTRFKKIDSSCLPICGVEVK